MSSSFEDYLSYVYNYDGPTTLPAKDKGPYSYQGYILKMMEMGFVGDDCVLHALCRMWGVRITVVNGHTLRERRICHQSLLQDAEIRLLVTGDHHYSAIGM